MTYNSLYSSKMIHRILTDKFIKRLTTRPASTGLNLWEQDLNPEIKHKIEKHWRDKLGKSLFDANNFSAEKFYLLSMFPYPSGQLHMGHIRVYSISDSIARFHRMRGKNVLHPMGWDAFGLPAENAAIEQGIDPLDWTEQNIDKMKKQFERLGCSFDWECELTTCNPDYYRWTQELFLKLFDKGLIYRKEALVNWDPVDHTVLADEQVDANGRSWRSGVKVEKKVLDQWFVRTTEFAKSLYDGLNDPMLKGWRDVIKLQKHWIGECNGLTIDFQLISDDQTYPKTVTLWTQAPELIEEAKFVAVAPGSFLAKIERCENTGEIFRRLKAQTVNPFTGDILPIFVTNAVGFAPFNDTHIGIPLSSQVDADFCTTVGIDFDPRNVQTADEIENKRREILKKAKELNIGRFPVSSKLKDWLISRQRYWGTPIPIVHCEKCKVQPVPRSQLPVILPELNTELEKGKSALQQAKEWLETECPKCGGTATRETDTMDTFVDSSWYFMRYIDSKNSKNLFSKEKADQFLPVDLYIGGKEHAVLHLYYARFINHFLHMEGLVPTREPFKQLLVQGMVMGKTYRIKNSGKYLKQDEVVMREKNKFFHKESGDPVVCSWEKMSKSKYNGIDPSDMFAEHGTDTTRLIILADVAPTSHRNWSPATFPGILKWQHRLWLTIRDFINRRKDWVSGQLKSKLSTDQFEEHEKMLFDSRNYYVKGVTFNIIEAQQLSVAISKMQGFTNSIRRAPQEVMAQGSEFEKALATQIIMLAPLAPHFASELWDGFCSAPRLTNKKDVNKHGIQWEKGVLQQKWPECDMEYELDLTVYLNSHEVLTLKVPRHIMDNMSEDEATKFVSTHAKFRQYLENWRIVGSKFHLVKGCNAIIHINTEKITEKFEIQETQV